ncbi:response regulator receiver domain-containing protein [Lutibacter oceani]|uniref:Response regulator receiver domain-containing protein n=1 Tax=Lutibacter oceani TaxID=1853311 RepID=A0A3D9RIB5_9FLAO|nr:response regulator [Lutibacter oceani]REE78706.1 response regulator receiver domain-containing protein [Lutibacter oceani]
MIDFLKEHYQWLFSGIGVTILVLIFSKIFNKKENEPVMKVSGENKNKVIINNFSQEKNSNNDNVEETDNNRLKDKTRILFVDDEHTKFKMVSILKKAGWKNTKSIKDITDLDDPKANEADIIFVDINGVGTTLFEDQGLGLASALKKKYPSKTIVIYSDETSGDRFHKALREVDDCLPKNAEPYQFINLIETFAK